jgi:hypothetical protein
MEINSINIQISQAAGSLSPAENGDTAGALKSRQAALADAARSDA